MKKQDIIEKVMTLLDENTPANSGLLNDVEEKPVEQIILSCLDPAWRELVMLSPVHLLPQKEVSSSTTSVTPSISIRTDLLRIVWVKADSWNRPARLILEDDPLYDMQFNEFTRGTKHKPIAVLRDTKVDLFICSESDNCKMNYVAMVDFSDEDSDLIPTTIADAYCLGVAAFVYAVLNENTLVQLMEGKRNALL